MSAVHAMAFKLQLGKNHLNTRMLYMHTIIICRKYQTFYMVSRGSGRFDNDLAGGNIGRSKYITHRGCGHTSTAVSATTPT